MGTNRFNLVTLTLVFDLIIKNFNLGYNISMVSTRALIFHMSVHCDKTFPWAPNFNLVILTLVLIFENFNLVISFDW
jgi:hypothetical protein